VVKTIVTVNRAARRGRRPGVPNVNESEFVATRLTDGEARRR